MTSPTRGSLPKYRFDDLTLDVGQRRVWRGSDTLQLSDLTFELLRVLVEAAPNVVSHHELAEKAWGPRRIVTPENLSQRVMVLRAALGDSADQSRYVEGVRGRGYRLIPEVRAPSLPEPIDRPGIGESMTPALPTFRDQRLRPRATGKLIYAVASAFLLTVAFIVGNSYLGGTTTPNVDAASPASVAGNQMLRFVVHAPEGSTFGMAPAEPSPALSPDGKQFAFVAPFESNKMLWTQTVGNPDDARPLTGTNGADSPFWSPDGGHIAFAAGGRLKRVAATGDGLPRDIATESPVWGGTWSADGTIVFAGSQGLYRLPSEGGPAEPLTPIDHARGEYSHRFPVMVPDGTRRFVYLVLSTQDEYGGLYLGSIDDPDLKVRLTPGDSNAAFGNDSSGRLHLLFVRNSTLLAQPFSTSRDALTDDPLVIASDKIGTAPTVRYAAFAASGRTLVFRPRFVPITRLVWIDRHRGVVDEQIGEESTRWRFPSLSPDGKELVALREDRSETSGLWLFDLASGKRERLVAGGWVSEPSGGALISAWTPDSQQVIYSFQQPDNWRLHRRIVTGADDVLFAGSTPGAKRVRDVTNAFVVFHDFHALWALPLSGGGQPHRLPIEGETNHARVSPNGRWLAYDVTEAGVTEVYVAAFPELTQRWLVSTAGGSDPQWRRDGHELYYIAPDETLMAVSVETATTFNARTPEPLFRASFDPTSLAFGSAYAAAPDGQRFLVAEIVGDSEPYLVATLNWMPQSQALD